MLYELDSPRTFTFIPADGELYLAHWFDESADVVRYLVVPFSPGLVAGLEAGHFSLREALDQPRLWMVDVDDWGVPAATTRTSLEDLPAEELPAVGTLLSPALEAVAPVRPRDGIPAPAGSVQPGSHAS